MSERTLTKFGIFLMPVREPMVSSWSNLSKVATPLSFTKVPGFRLPRSSFTNSVLVKSFTVMVSVKSVTSNMTIVLSFLISRLSVFRTLPRMVTSPTSPMISSMGMGSSSKSFP